MTMYHISIIIVLLDISIITVLHVVTAVIFGEANRCLHTSRLALSGCITQEHQISLHSQARQVLRICYIVGLVSYRLAVGAAGQVLQVHLSRVPGFCTCLYICGNNSVKLDE